MEDGTMGEGYEIQCQVFGGPGGIVDVHQFLGNLRSLKHTFFRKGNPKYNDKITRLEVLEKAEEGFFVPINRSFEARPK